MHGTSGINRAGSGVGGRRQPGSPIHGLSRILLLGAISLAVLGVAAGSASAQSMRRWAAIEVDELERLTRHLRRDEAITRKQLTRLEQQRDALVLFCNGVSNPSTRNAVRKSLNSLEQSELVRELLQAEVPPQPADEFICQRRLCGILADGGSLVEPPPVLDLAEADSDLRRCRVELEDAWESVRNALQDGHQVSQEHVLEFQDAVKGYLAAANPVLSRATRTARIHGRRHLGLLQGLAVKIDSPSGQLTLSQMVRGEGRAFPGGMVAELLEHLLKHDLAFRQGGEVHAALTTLGHGLTTELDELISIAEDRIEVYKAQNPAQNAAIKVRVAGTLVPPGPVGLNSYSYGYALPKRSGGRAGWKKPTKQQVGLVKPGQAGVEAEAGPGFNNPEQPGLGE